MSAGTIQQILDQLERTLLGKRKKLEYALATLLAGGHLLIEDVPGVGKTTLAKSLSNIFQAEFNRVQFTSDLLPSDLLGVSVFIQNKSAFEFKPGPIFCNVLLADEINRANPKTQSALLEAMHDGQISIDGKPQPLPDPFFVVATQNSRDSHGTFPLPESQLDRFLMRIDLGYPEPEDEKRVIRGDYQQVFKGEDRKELETLKRLRLDSSRIHVSPEVLDYLFRLVLATRQHGAVRVGVSPRGGQALYRAAQALALVRGRHFVIPDDLRELAPLVCGHRLLLNHSYLGGKSIDAQTTLLFDEILQRVNPPA